MATRMLAMLAASILHEPEVRVWMRGGIEWSASAVSVPEPSTFALLALGLLALSVRRSNGWRVDHK